MCQYCEENKNLMTSEEVPISTYNCINGNILTDADGFNIRIFYCPICGRSLDESADNTSAGSSTHKTASLFKNMLLPELGAKIREFKERANRPNAWDYDVAKLLEDCRGDVDLAVSLILDNDIHNIPEENKNP